MIKKPDKKKQQELLIADLNRFIGSGGRLMWFDRIENWRGDFVTIIVLPGLSDRSLDIACEVEDYPESKLRYDVRVFIIPNEPQKISALRDVLVSVYSREETLRNTSKIFLNNQGIADFHGLSHGSQGKFMIKYALIDM